MSLEQRFYFGPVNSLFMNNRFIQLTTKSVIAGQIHSADTLFDHIIT